MSSNLTASASIEKLLQIKSLRSSALLITTPFCHTLMTFKELADAQERRAKLFGAYTAFIVAGIVAMISGDGHLKTEPYVVTLWVLSLPVLVTYMLVDYTISVKQHREASVVRGLLQLIGLAISNLGTAALLGSFSWIVAGVYILSIPCLMAAVILVTFLGNEKEHREL